MKRIINLLFWTALILFFIYRHIYHKITHMNSDDLEWVTNRYIGEIMVFESETGIIDTVKIWDIHIHNCISPYNMNIDYWVDEYIARASIDYLFTGSNSIDGYFYIIKENNNEPVYVGNGINQKWSKV